MDRSPLLDRHLAAKARLAPRPEAEGSLAPLTFGDVPGEYVAATEGCALLDASDRGRVSVSGPDAADFLHRLLANHVKSLEPGRGNRSLLLSSKGKVLHDFDLVRRDEGFELSTKPLDADLLRAALDKYLFSEKVQLETTSDAHAPLELVGPQAPAILARAFDQRFELAEHAERTIVWEAERVAVSALSIAGSPGFRVDGGAPLVAELWNTFEHAGARPCGLAVRDILRVEAGAALFGVDVDENVYPQEALLVNAFALDKGCYVGQEVVAKIDTYGGLNKRLEALRVEHSDPVARGTKLVQEDEHGKPQELGLVTSWAYSFVLDTGLVLAYVKRRHQEPGTEFGLDDPSGPKATIVPLPVRRVTAR